MFRKISSLILVALMMLCLGSCAALTKTVEVTAETDVPPKAVYLGDSIAAGFGLEGYSGDDLYNCDSYANILADTYNEELTDKCGHTTVNEAVSGSETSDLLKRLESGELDETLADSDAIVISIGGNNLLHVLMQLMSDVGYNEESGSIDLSDADIWTAVFDIIGLDRDLDKALDGFEADLREIVTGISGKTDGKIFIQSLYDPFEYFKEIKPLANLSQEKIDRLNSIIYENAEEYSYTVIDVSGAFRGRSGELTNIAQYDIHPNAEGHKVIAVRVDSAIRKSTYTYTELAVVTDEDAVRVLVILCIAGAVMTAAAAIAVIVAVMKHKKKNNS